MNLEAALEVLKEAEKIAAASKKVAEFDESSAALAREVVAKVQDDLDARANERADLEETVDGAEEIAAGSLAASKVAAARAYADFVTAEEKRAELARFAAAEEQTRAEEFSHGVAAGIAAVVEVKKS